MLEHTACAAVLKRKVARFLVRRWALRPERREAAPWGGATTGDGKTPWNVRPAGFPDSGVHRVEERWKWGQVFCCRTRYARGWGFHLQARVWGSLGARGGGVWDAVVGRVLAMGLRAEVAEQGVVGRCRPGWGGGTEHGSAVTVGGNIRDSWSRSLDYQRT